MSVPAGRGRHLPPGSSASSLSSSSASSTLSTPAKRTSRTDLSVRQPEAEKSAVDTKFRHSVTADKHFPSGQAEPARTLRDRKVEARRPAPGASSSTTTSSPSLPRPVLSDLAHSLLLQDHCEHDTRQLVACETELNRLGPKLKRPLDPRLVEGLADRVIDTLAKASHLNLAPVMQTLVKVLDGPEIAPPALRTVFNRLMDAQSRLEARVFTGAVLALVAGLGADAIHAPQRHALLECLLQRLASTPTPDQRLADAVVAALAARPLGNTFLGAIASRALAPGGTGSVAARTALLQGLSHALGPLHDHTHRADAYLALVRAVTPLDPAIVREIANVFHLREMSEGADGEAHVQAWFASLTRWAVTLDATSGVTLLAGACAGLWNDTDFSPRQLFAAVRGMLSVDAPEIEAAVIGLLTGFMSEAVRHRWIHAEHVDAFLNLFPTLAATPQQERRTFLALTVLCRVLAHHEWPRDITEALVDGVLARATAWPRARVVEAGRCIGECLASLDPKEPLFTQTLTRMTQLQPLDRAARLLAGFARGLALDHDDALALGVLGQAIARPEVADTVRAKALGGAIATGLNASIALTQTAQGTQAWRAPLQALADHKAGTPYAPLLSGLDLLDSPVQATLASGLPRPQQQELLEFAWTELSVPNTALMHRQVEHLRDAGFQGEEPARGDMLLALFQQGGRVAGGRTFLVARDILARAMQNTALAATVKGAGGAGGAEGDGKASAPTAHQDMTDTLYSQLEALYRYYITASAPPSYVLNPPAGEVIKRLQWLEGIQAGSLQKVSEAERAMLRALRDDYAHLLAG